MTENRLLEVAGHWLPRIEVAGIPSATAKAVMEAAGSWRNWCSAWSAEGERHQALAESALAEGHRLTAGEAFARAALCHHFAQFMFFDDPTQKAAAAARKVALFRSAAPLLAPPARPLVIPFEGGALSAYLRRPDHGEGNAVILIPGSDSTKEEFPSLEADFLARGLATVSVDGPGQGEGRSFGPLRPDIAAAVAATLAALRDAGLYGGVALVGMAFGGHLALRAASVPGIAAVVSVNGFFDLAAMWDGFPPVYRDNMRHVLDAPDPEDARARATLFTLAASPPPACPVLVLHGGRDRIFPPEQARAQAAWAGPGARLELLADGNHVCNNVPWRYRPLAADWVADRLAAPAPPKGPLSG